MVNPVPSSSEPATAGTTGTPAATRIRNFLVVLAATVLSVAIFLGLNTQSGTASLGALAKAAVPWEVARGNGKPTLVEFYANWCTSCQAMAPAMGQLKSQYGDRVNFVMLNVDNTKWLPEVLEYRVDGIPHFVFMGADGQAQAEAIGEQPKTVMAANLLALGNAEPLPYAQATGQTSEFSAPVSAQSTGQNRGKSGTGSTDPRSHGSQVVPAKS